MPGSPRAIFLRFSAFTPLLVLLVLLALPARSLAAPEGAHADMRLQQHVVQDAKARMKAMVVVTPADWRFSGRADWDLQSIAYPARLRFQAQGPRDGAEVLYWPMEHYHFMQGGGGWPPPGNMHTGAVVMQPVTPEQYMQQLVKKMRPGASGISLKSSSKPQWLMDLTNPAVESIRRDLAQARMQGRAWADVAEQNYEYTENGQRFEERMYTVITYTTMVLPTQMRPTYTTWTTSGIFSRRAHAGTFAAHRAEFELIEKNSDPDPQWLFAMVSTGQQLIREKIDSLNKLGDITRRMVAEKNKFNEQARQVVKERQASSDRISRMREDALLGIDRYEGSEGRVALPSGYKHAWERKSGEIILTDNPNFNPNTAGDPGSWNSLKRARD